MTFLLSWERSPSLTYFKHRIRKSEIEQVLHLKSEIREIGLDRLRPATGIFAEVNEACPSNVILRISGFEVLDSSDFRFSHDCLTQRGRETCDLRFLKRHLMVENRWRV